MKFRRLKNVLAGFDAKQDALKDQAASETPPGYERVRTPQGRLAHLKHPQLGVLCGWRAAWTPADPSLPLCRMCKDYAKTAERQVAP